MDPNSLEKSDLNNVNPNLSLDEKLEAVNGVNPGERGGFKINLEENGGLKVEEALSVEKATEPEALQKVTKEDEETINKLREEAKNTPPPEPNKEIDNARIFGARKEGKTDARVALDFIGIVTPYIKGRENLFRTESFSALDKDLKKSVYSSINSAIQSLHIEGDQNSLKKLEGTLQLMGEPGVSFQDGKINIGPKATKDDIVNFLKNTEIVPPPIPEQAQNQESAAEQQITPPPLPEQINQAEQPPPIPTQPEPATVSTTAPGFEQQAGELPRMGNIANTGDFIPEEKEKKDSFEKPRLVINNDLNPDESRKSGGEFTPPAIEEQKIIPEWKKGEEWSDLMRSRKAVAEAEAKAKKEKRDFIDVEKIAEEQYKQRKNLVAEKIKESVKAEMGTPLNADDPEYNDAFKKRLDDELFEFAKSENKEYDRIFDDNRERNWKDKGLEFAGKALNSGFVKWYTKQNKWVRLGATTALFTVGGYALGAAAVGGTVFSAAGYGIGRGIRGSASILAGGAARVAAEKRWSEEDIDKEVKEREYIIKNSSASVSEKSEELKKLEAWEANEKKWARIKKGIVTIGVGAGAGILAGLTEGVATGKTLGPENVSRPNTGDSENFPVNRISRAPFQPNVGPSDHVPPGPSSESIATTPPPNPTEEVMPVPKTRIAESFLKDPKVAIHEVKAGDSTWRLLQKTLDNDSDFKSMTEAQKTYVLSSFTNKVLQSPDNFIGKGGSLNVGDKADFTKLFEDGEKVKAVLKEARDKIQEGSKQETSIVENNRRIALWVKENPGKPLDSKAFSEILNTKPKPLMTIIRDQERLAREGGDVPEVKTYASGMEESEPSLSEKPLEKPQTGIGEKTPEQNKIPPPEDLSGAEEKGRKLAEEIDAAKKRIEELEKGKTEVNNQKEGMEAVRSLSGDSRKVIAEMITNEKIEEYLRRDLDQIYGKSGFLGLGKKSGINSSLWKDIEGKQAIEIMSVYENPEGKPNLPEKTIENLRTTEEDRKLIEHIYTLRKEGMEATKSQLNKNGTDVIPYKGELMISYLKRLGRFVAEHLKEPNEATMGQDISNMPKAA